MKKLGRYYFGGLLFGPTEEEEREFRLNVELRETGKWEEMAI